MDQTCGAEERVDHAATVRGVRRVAAGRVVRTLLVAWLAVLPPGPVNAVEDGLVSVRLDGRILFQVGPNDELDAASRGQRVERRLATLLDRPAQIESAVVERGPTNEQRTIRVAGATVVTVTPADAEEELTTVDALAGRWAVIIDDALERARTVRDSPAERFVTEVRVAVTTAFSRLAESAITIVPRMIAATLVLGLFWFAATVVRRALRALFHRVIADLTVENLLKQVAYYFVWLVGLIIAADALGFSPEAVVTGLGLTGLALGFALKDILSNFVSGLLILALRPFHIGDEIQVGDAEGRVERIDLRATNIRTYDGRLVLVPNAELFTSRVTNNTASPVRRATVALTLGYDVDLRSAASAVLAATREVDGVLAEPPASVRLDRLGPDGMELEARFWTDSRRSDYVATASAVREAIVATLARNRIPIPDRGVFELRSSTREDVPPTSAVSAGP